MARAVFRGYLDGEKMSGHRRSILVLISLGALIAAIHWLWFNDQVRPDLVASDLRSRCEGIVFRRDSVEEAWKSLTPYATVLDSTSEAGHVQIVINEKNLNWFRSLGPARKVNGVIEFTDGRAVKFWVGFTASPL